MVVIFEALYRGGSNFQDLDLGAEGARIEAPQAPRLWRRDKFHHCQR